MSGFIMTEKNYKNLNILNTIPYEKKRDVMDFITIDTIYFKQIINFNSWDWMAYNACKLEEENKEEK